MPSAWNGLDDRFQIDTGFFGITADSVLRFEGEDVSLEKDLGVSKYANDVLGGRRSAGALGGGTS